MKRITANRMVFLLLLIIIPVYSLENTWQFAGGEGTSTNPYKVKTAYHLNNVRLYKDKYFRQTANITYDSTWDPIGTQNSPFKGNYDGDNYRISNLHYTNILTDYVGLFAYVDNAVINDLNLLNVNFKGREYVGALIGFSMGSTDVAGCYSTGSVEGSTKVGGLIGYMRSSGSTVDDCHSSCSVVSSSNYGGGLIGYTITTVITDSYATGSVSGASSYKGGLIGYSGGISLSGSYAAGNVSGSSLVGGLIGQCISSNVNRCYSSGTVSGSYPAGLIAYFSESSVYDSYSLSNLSSSGAGFITNALSSTVSRCYSKGNVSSGRGFIYTASSATVTDCYWDTETSGISVSAAGEGKTTAEMQLQQTYNGWDFTNIWNIHFATNGGYPFLQWQGSAPSTHPFAGGSGTSSDPYEIADAEQLNQIKNYLDKDFIQTADIELGVSPWSDGNGWIPTGDDTNPFAGNYDGNGYNISNLTINRPTEARMGLFGATNGATIENIDLLYADISGSTHTGGIVGQNLSASVVQNCTVSGSVSGYDNVGGVVGYNKNSGTVISRCYSTATVNGHAQTGGIAGYNNDLALIEKCHTKSTVKGTVDEIGGLVGVHYGDAVINDCYSTGSVDGVDMVGGLVGHFVDNAYITNSFSTGTVTGDTNTGGFAGGGTGTVTSCYWDTETSGQSSSAYGTGKTTAQMRDISTFSGWDFSTPVWRIHSSLNNGYPYLNWEGLIPTACFAGGSGTESDPYQISNAVELNDVRYYLDSYFIQTADIDLGTSPWNEGTGWSPLGTGTEMFTGSFNGDGHTILNLTVNRPTEHRMGLFGYISDAVLENMKLDSASVAGYFSTGTLAGDNLYGSKIINCSSSNVDVSGGENVGGLIGYNKHNDTVIENCYTTGTVSGINQIGGICGYNNEFASVSYCYSECDVTGTGYSVGGLVGTHYGNAFITDCYARGSVSGNDKVGGLAGNFNDPAEIIRCYSTGAVNGNTNEGGLTGYGDGTDVLSSYWDMNTSGLSSSTTGSGKITAEMKSQSTFTGWDFISPLWSINGVTNDGYPYIDTSGLAPNFAGGSGTEADPYQVSTPYQLHIVRNHYDSYFIQINDINLSDVQWSSGEGWIPICNPTCPFGGNYDGNGHSVTNLTIDRPDENRIGLFGVVTEGSITDLTVSGNVTGHYSTGMIAGDNLNSAIENCHTLGTVSGFENVGGVTGYSKYSQALVDNCSSNCSVSGTNQTGGITGYNNTDAVISNCFTASSVTGSGYSIGGIAGTFLSGEVTDCYSRASVTGDSKVGGAFGNLDSYACITNCYSTGGVTGNSDTGGLSGYGTCTETNSYWDTETSGKSTSTEGTGKTTAEMTVGYTFSAWDLDTPVWKIYTEYNDGYPFLEWQDYSIFAGGAGTEAEPYLISNAVELNNVRNYLNGHFIQTDDIELGVSPWNEGSGWEPIGTNEYRFNGSYDGQGNSINDLTIDITDADGTGLFGYVENADLSDVHINNANINARAVVGTLAGWTENTNITECSGTGLIIADSQTTNDNTYAGGLIGRHLATDSETSSIVRCHTDVVITGLGDKIGGITGMTLSGYNEVPGGSFTMTDCYALGQITGEESIGGLIGIMDGTGGTITVTNCYSTGLITGTAVTGGLIAEKIMGTVNNCFWDTETSGQSSSAAGTGKTSTDMKLQTTFTGWDFSTPVWNIHGYLNNGYPYLECEGLIQPPFSGAGTIIDPFLVANADDLNNVRDYLNLCFLQTADIELGVSPWTDGEGWEPIGSSTTPFTGSYEADGHKISNLTISRSALARIGLFSVISHGSVSNMVLDSVSVLGNTHTGGLAGQSLDSTQVVNCSVSGDVTGVDNVGGLIGYNRDAGTVISQCSSSGTVTGRSQSGGIAGYNNVEAVIERSFSTCDVTGTTDELGGLVGVHYGDAVIANCYATGNVTGDNKIGGLVGNFYLTPAFITNSYSTGTVTGNSSTGGLVGAGTGVVTSSYWDTETSGQSSSVHGTGLTTEEMHDHSSYSGWDFIDETANGTDDIWGITPVENENYPFLSWQGYTNVFMPKVATSEVSDITAATAVGNWSLTYLGTESITGHGICWDTDSLPIISDNFYGTGPSDSLGFFSGIINGLSPYTTYYVRAYAVNAVDTVYGNQVSFVSSPSLPAVSTQQTTGISDSEAILNGSITDCGVPFVSDHGFCWSAAPDPLMTDSLISLGAVDSAGVFSFELNGLSPYTTYYVRSFAINLADTVYGGEVNFTTLPLGASISTLAVTDITDSTAVGNGEILSLSVPSATAHGFCWSTAPEPTVFDSLSNEGAVDSTGTFNSLLTALTEETMYYVRAYSLNEVDTVYGGEVIFTTDLFNPFTAGQGTEADPYQISNAEELNSIRDFMDAYFIQTADIDLSDSLWSSGSGWNPIGTSINKFTGFYNGNGYTIDNLTINDRTYDGSGLFGYSLGAEFTDIHITNAVITSRAVTGVLVGWNENTDMIKCSASGVIAATHQTVNSNTYAGGISGRIYINNNDTVSISKCYSDVNISGSGDRIGCLSGLLMCGYSVTPGGIVNVSDCYTVGSVNGISAVGGFIGRMEGNGTGSITIITSYSSGAVTGNEAGGFVGSSGEGSATDCFWDTGTSGQAASVLGTGKTTAEMTADSTYASWDFSTPIWNRHYAVNNGYPYLEWEGREIPLLAPLNVTAEISGSELIISWDEAVSASSYRIYAADNPYGTFTDISESGTYNGNSWSIVYTEDKKFYYVTSDDGAKNQKTIKIKQVQNLR